MNDEEQIISPDDVFNQQNSIMKPLDIANLLGIIATTFSTGMGFIFGYYFKGNH